MKVILFPLILVSFTFSSVTFPVTSERLGVPTLEELQKRQAIKAADTTSLSITSSDAALHQDALIPTNEQSSTIKRSVKESLAPVSLEEKIRQQKVQSQLEFFGYELFAGVSKTFSPLTSVPVPMDYIIGPGDVFTVQSFSAADVQYTLPVTRDGLVLAPEAGALAVSGLTFEAAKSLIKSEIEKKRIGIKTVVTLSEMRSIQIMLVGEVHRPGTYTVSAFSTLLNTLISSGGIKQSGSLRSISVRRGGSTIATMDLYDLLVRGDDSSNIFLRHGDLIFIPPIRSTISVAGDVLRPAIYEIKNERNVGQVLSLAGGFLPTASKNAVQIERITPSGQYTLLQANMFTDGASIDINNGDIIRVFPVLDKMDNIVLMNGHVLTPGGFQWRSGQRISDIIGSKSLLRQGADLNVGFIQRENPVTKRTEAYYFNLENALTRFLSRDNLILTPRDQITIFNTHSSRADQLSSVVQKLRREASAQEPEQTIDLKGFLRHPGTYPLQNGIRLLDMLNAAGGIQSGTDLNYALLARTDLKSDNIFFVQLDLNRALQDRTSDHNPVLKPKDKVYIFDFELHRASLIKQPIERLRRETRMGRQAPVVSVGGAVFHQGSFPLVPGMRIKDLIHAAGGMKEEAYGLYASLSRHYIYGNENSRVENISISLDADVEQHHSINFILKPNDHLVLRTKPEWDNKTKTVSVEGEVQFPGRYRVDKRDTLCSLVHKVGGFTEDAYTFGTVFLRDSVRRKEQQALDRMHDQLDRLLTDVHVSPGIAKDEKMPKDQNPKDLLSVIKQLSPEKAAGRLVIDIKEAVGNCGGSADLVLEDGDRIIVPKYHDQVSVVGQVYFATSHKFRKDRAALDYIALSGGMKELAQNEHAFVVQANGEVMSIRSSASSWGRLFSPKNVKVTPGSTIYVPLSVDRINGRESYASIVDIFYKNTLSLLGVVNLINRYGD